MTRTALITGAGGGLGAAIAARMAEDGYRIALLDWNRETVEKQARAIPGALAFATDISDERAVEAVVAKICEAFDTAPDVLVNHAGIVRFGNILEQSIADFRSVLEVNLVGTYIMS